MRTGVMLRERTYHAENLHTKQQWITENVSWVRQRIFLPHLTKEIHPTRHTVMIIHKIALKKAVNGTTCSMSAADYKSRVCLAPHYQTRRTRKTGYTHKWQTIPRLDDPRILDHHWPDTRYWRQQHTWKRKWPWAVSRQGHWGHRPGASDRLGSMDVVVMEDPLKPCLRKRL
jgi:hypothetical protein